MNIILIGLPGSGKSTMGRFLADAKGLNFLDTDEEVEKRGLTIPKIFEQLGEERFREMESEAVLAASSLKDAVIATGGGTVLKRGNMLALKENGVAVFLDRSIESIREGRLAGRPLLTDANKIYELAEARRPYYLEYADYILDTEEKEETVARLLMIANAFYPPKGFAVIGDPIAHTKSPAIHDAIFKELGVGHNYSAIWVKKDDLRGFVGRVRETGALLGFNATIPHKEALLELVDEVSPEARRAGAINTVVVRDKKLLGFNTDTGGLLLALKKRGAGYKDRVVTLIGAGGAAAGVAATALLEGVAELRVVNRDLKRGEALVNAMGGGIPLPLGEISKAARGADMLINATPLGMSGVKGGFADLEFLKGLNEGALVVDLIYNPLETPLLREAARLGFKTMNGADMLVYQAILAEEIFLNRKLEEMYNLQFTMNGSLREV